MAISRVKCVRNPFEACAAAFLLVFCLFPSGGRCAAQAGPDAAAIIAKADEIRILQEDSVAKVKVTSVSPSGGKSVYTYEALTKGKTKTLVKTLSPLTERGNTLLIRDNDFWAFLPGVSKPIRISLQQRLTGEVSNGDIVRVNLTGNYSAKLTGKEIVDKVHCLVFSLTAINEFVTYGKVRYWVRADDYSPVKAEFYAVSGRLLKTCSFEDYREIGGRLRPSKLVLRNPLVKGQYSIIEYEAMNAEELPERYFTKDYMKKIKY
jgi:outer membrane lipoprotein-sorting protein